MINAEKRGCRIVSKVAVKCPKCGTVKLADGRCKRFACCKTMWPISECLSGVQPMPRTPKTTPSTGGNGDVGPAQGAGVEPERPAEARETPSRDGEPEQPPESLSSGEGRPSKEEESPLSGLDSDPGPGSSEQEPGAGESSSPSPPPVLKLKKDPEEPE